MVDRKRFLPGIVVLGALLSLQAICFAQQSEEERTLKVVLKRNGQCVSEKSYLLGDDEEWTVRLVGEQAFDNLFRRGVARLKSARPAKISVAKVRKDSAAFEDSWITLSFETRELKEEETVVEFNLIGARFTGRVVDDSDKPVGGVLMSARLKPDSLKREDVGAVVFAVFARTGEDGKFSLGDLLPGGYVLELEEMGIQPDGSYKLGNRCFWAGVAVEFAASPERQQEIPVYRLFGPSRVSVQVALGGQPMRATTFSYKPGHVGEKRPSVSEFTIPGMDYHSTRDGNPITVVREPVALQTDEKGMITFCLPRIPLSLTSVTIQNARLGEIRKRTAVCLAGGNEEDMQCSIPAALASLKAKLPGAEKLPRTYRHYEVRWRIRLFPHHDNKEEYGSYREIDPSCEFEMQNLLPGKYLLWLRANLVPTNRNATLLDPEAYAEAFAEVNAEQGRSIELELGGDATLEVVLEEQLK